LAAFLLSGAKRQTLEIQDRRELQRRFRAIVTKNIDVAQDFSCSGTRPRDPFTFDRQWIFATSKLLNEVDNDLQQWRSQQAQSLGVVSAFLRIESCGPLMIPELLVLFVTLIIPVPIWLFGCLKACIEGRTYDHETTLQSEVNEILGSMEPGIFVRVFAVWQRRPKACIDGRGDWS
jgi:hypothetical protein